VKNRFAPLTVGNSLPDGSDAQIRMRDRDRAAVGNGEA
jgi:hypothetical protein